ncbi:MAG: aminotransferase class V-fold PLP-dependent enzyme [Armatimonadetes bacterium]|nr:MAG: aminotransferase class V-fold PLP-dependent enzyme [Armatimonadota bacterium]
MQDLAKWRKEFPILERRTYLISNSLGAMPRRAEEALLEYTRRWKVDGVRAWQDWWELPGQVAEKIAPIVGAEPGSITLHLNVTTTEAIVESCFEPTAERNKVVYTDMNFPSVTYFWKAQEPRGYQVVTVPSDDGVTVNLNRLLEAIDEHTVCVPISHALFRSAFVQDAKAIAERCREVGAYLILDIYQSAGVVPVKLKEWGVDFAIGGTLKWLCGGPGNAFLYVRPDLAPHLKPRLTGWISDERPFDFVVNDHVYTDGPYRFMNGTPNIPGLYAAIPGLEIVSEVGVDAIRRHSLALTQRLLDGARERGWKVNCPLEPGQRGGTVAIDFPDGYEVAQELIERDVLVDYRPKAGVRVSPHFYNTLEEIERFFEVADEILQTGAHLRHKGTRTVVT